jgi:uncharacterized protein YndB with AHSA1/START domain
VSAPVTLVRSILVARPVADVFAYVSDYRNDPRWRRGVDAMQQRPDGPVVAGTTTEEHLRALGRRLVVHARVVESVPGRRLEFTSTLAPLKSSGFREVTPEGGGARLTYGLTVELSGIYRLLAGPLSRNYGRRIEEDLARLAALLEAGAHAAGGKGGGGASGSR